MKKKILCYGDSNTWGYMPGTGNRYPDDVRWTKLVQKELGDDYEIIESGISGRTTVFDKGWNEYLNGKKGLGYALHTHYPLDGVVVMLGGNDLVEHTAESSKNGIDEIVRMLINANEVFRGTCRMLNEGFKVLLVIPPHHPEIATKGVMAYRVLAEKRPKITEYYKEVAKNRGVDCLDATSIAEVSDIDCLHLSEKGHKQLADAITNKLKEMYEKK